MRVSVVPLVLLFWSCTPPSVSVSCSSDADCAVGRCLEKRCILAPAIDAGNPAPREDAGRPKEDAGDPDPPRDAGDGPSTADAGQPQDGGVVDDGESPDAFPDDFVDPRYHERARIRISVPVEIPTGAHIIPVKLAGFDIIADQVTFYNEDQTVKLPFESDDEGADEVLYWVRVENLRPSDVNNAIWVYFRLRQGEVSDGPTNPWAGLWDLVIHDDEGNSNEDQTFTVNTGLAAETTRLGRGFDTSATSFVLAADFVMGANGSLLLVFDETQRIDEVGGANVDENVIANDSGTQAFETSDKGNFLQFRTQPGNGFCGQMRQNNPTSYVVRWDPMNTSCYRDNFVGGTVTTGTTGGTYRFFENVHHRYVVDELWVSSRQLTHEESIFQAYAVRHDLAIVETAPLIAPPGVVPNSAALSPTHAWIFGTDVEVVFDTGSGTSIDLVRTGNSSAPAAGEGFVYLSNDNHFESSNTVDLGSCVSDRQFSVEAWVLPDSDLNRGPARILQHGTSSDDLDLMLGQETSKYHARARINGGTGFGLEANLRGGIVERQVQHLTFVHNGDNRQLFVGTASVDSEDVTSELDFASAPLTIGDAASGDRQWFGALYYVAIYCKALDATQIAHRDAEVRMSAGF